MAANFWTARRRKIGLFAGLLSLVLFVGLLSINAILAPVIGRKIKSAIIEGSDSLYQVSFKIRVNVFTGSATLDDIHLTVDSTRARLAEKVYLGSAKSLQLNGAAVLAYLFHKKLEIDQLVLTDPDLNYTIRKATKKKEQKSLVQQISPLKLISVRVIDLTNIKLSISDLSTAKASMQDVSDLNVEASDLLIDPEAKPDTNRTLFCRDIAIGMKNFSGNTEDRLYKYGFRDLHFSTKSDRLTLRAIRLKPLEEKIFFERSKADRFDIALDSLVLEHFNYRSFLDDHFLAVKKMSLIKGHIGVFANPHPKLTAEDRVNTFPHEMIRTLPVHFTIDTLLASGILVSYREVNNDDDKTGVLEFKNTKAQFLNISNEEGNLKTRPLAKARLSSFLMGRGKLELSINFNLADKVYSYDFRGRLSALPVAVMNPVIMPLGLVEIKKGDLKSLDFSIKADRRKSTGTLHLLYNDLGVDILKPDYRKKVLKTLLTNIIVAKHNNPDQPGGEARFAKVIFLRPKSYPFFRTLWETLFSGIKSCAGIGYAVKTEPGKPLTRKERKARKKALKKAIKARKNADKDFNKKLGE